jgi:hypothetical protein
MSETARWTGPGPPQSGRQQQPSGQGDGANLADILERVLDKGIVIAGDIQVNLLDIELLTIKIRLVVASVDRAKEMGIDWWERDPTLSAGRRELEDENRDLRARIEALERNGHRETGERDLPGMPDEEPHDDEPYDEVHDAEVLDDEPDDDTPADDAPDDVDDVEDEPEDGEEPDDERPDEHDAPAADERPTKGNGRSGRAGRATGDRDGATRTGNGSGERARRSRGDADRDGAEREMPARRRPGSKRSSPTREE